MFLSISLIFVDLLILPAVFIIWFTRRNYQSKIDWILQFLFTATYILLVFNSGRWDWVSYYLRYVLGGIFILSAFLSYKKTKASPLFKQLEYKRYVTLASITILTGVYSVNIFSTINGLNYDSDAIELDFPLKNGTYYITHGGNSSFINHHHSYPPQRYAVDVVKLNGFGIRAMGIIPKQLSRYEIFEDIIYSPCDGKVIKVAGDRPDMTPLEMDRSKPLGNYVAIRHKDTTVYLAHMMKGSLSVKQGDLVKSGQILGKVGNSGFSSQPHLHIHAEKGSQGIPMRFDNNFFSTK